MPSAKTKILLLFALFSSKSLTLSIPQATNPTNLLAANTTLNGELHCYPKNPLNMGPSVEECITAIRRLPSSDVHGNFHGAGAGDARFELPVSKSSSRCEISVGLKSFAPDDGTWLGLTLAATQLIIACANRDGYLPKRGGWIDAGDTDRIRITFGNVRLVLDKVTNETIVIGEA